MEILKKYWLIILIAFVVRVLIAATTYHADVRIVDYSSAVILREGNLNPYQYAYSGLANKVKSDELPDDLPLQYWVHLPFDVPLRILINTRIEDVFLANTSSLFGNIGLNLHLLVIKFPLIIVDILLALVIAYTLPVNLRKKGLLFWLFNPVTLWATVAVGQVDIWPTFFVALALLLLQRNKPEWAAFSLGAGAALKSFPFLILPFLLLSYKGWGMRIKLLLISIIPWVLSVFPYIFSSEFRQYALFAPQLDKIFYSKINLSGGEGVYLTIFVLIFLYLFYLKTKRGLNDFITFSAASLLLVLALSHFHVQWFLWVMPMIIILLLKKFDESLVISGLLLFLSWGTMLFLFEASLQVKLFSPVFPSLDSGMGLAEVLAKSQAEFIRNIAATVFAASTAYFSYRILSRNEE